MGHETESSQYETIRLRIIRYLRFQYQNVFDVREHAEDFANEAFAKALEKGYDVGYSVIWRIADNLAKQAYRNQQARPPACEYRDEWYQGQSAPLVREDARQEQHELLGSRMSRLDRLPRIALEFRLENRSVREIGELMDVPVGTVKSWLSRSRQRLRGSSSRWGGSREDCRSLHGKWSSSVAASCRKESRPRNSPTTTAASWSSSRSTSATTSDGI